MHQIGARHHLLVEQRVRTVIGTRTPLFHDHSKLLGKLVFRKGQIHHAIGFQLQRKRQPGFVQLLVVAGVVARGKCIVTSAGAGDDAGKFPDRDFPGSFEHHVFEHVRDAGRTAHFIHAAGAIPHHGNSNRRAMVFLDQDFHSVAQCMLRDVRRDCTCPGARQGQGKREASDQGNYRRHALGWSGGKQNRIGHAKDLGYMGFFGTDVTA